MSSYQTLIGDRSTEGSIRNWLANATVPATTIVHDAETWLWRRLRLREMLTVQSGVSLALNSDAHTLPSDYVQRRALTFVGDYKARARFVTVEDLEQRRDYTQSGSTVTISEGPPTHCAVYGTQLLFNVKADQAYPLRLVYYAQPADLSPSNPTNFLTGRGFLALKYACLAFAAEFLVRDQTEIDRWLTKAAAEAMALIQEDETERYDEEGRVEVI